MTVSSSTACALLSLMMVSLAAGSPAGQYTLMQGLVQQASCESDGNVYTIIPGTGCAMYNQMPNSGTFTCIDGTIFNTISCVCDYVRNTVCNDPTTTTPTTTTPTTTTPTTTTPTTTPQTTTTPTTTTPTTTTPTTTTPTTTTPTTTTPTTTTPTTTTPTTTTPTTTTPTTTTPTTTTPTTTTPTTTTPTTTTPTTTTPTTTTPTTTTPTTTTPTTTTPTTTTPTTTTPTTIPTSCISMGNIYTQVPGTSCSSFTQQDIMGALNPVTFTCNPTSLQFNVVTCVCDWAVNTVCSV